MLENIESGCLGQKIPERCKPDYEAMIKTNQERQRINNNLQEAVFEYAGKSRLRGKMAELIGELVSEDRILKANTNDLIRQQEQSA